MAWKHPPSILVIAILHLIGGIGGLLCGMCGAGMQAALQNNPRMLQFGPPNPQLQKEEEFQKELESNIERELPYHRIITYANTGYDLLLAVMLVSAGIGLLYLKQWARTLSLVYAVLSLLNKAFTIVYTVVTWLVISAFMDQQAQSDANLALTVTIVKGTFVVAIGTLVLFAIYPIVVLIVLTRPHVKAAFAGEGAPAIDSEPEDWDERRFRDDRGPPPETYTREP